MDTILPVMQHVTRGQSRSRQQARTRDAVGGVELDVPDRRAVHVVLDQAGPGRAQVEQRHEPVCGAHRNREPTLVKAHRCQALSGLRGKNSPSVSQGYANTLRFALPHLAHPCDLQHAVQYNGQLTCPSNTCDPVVMCFTPSLQ